MRRGFAVRYAQALDLAGQVFITYAGIGAAGSAQADARRQLRTLIERVSSWHARTTDLIEHGALGKLDAWHVYGSLVADMERLLTDLDHTKPARTAGPAT
ncbi:MULTISPECIES: hypothetical protein [unclassified Streptomyces]|uniref:hypothetical protein n=1 Tax=unclassified Streptomyces TaxID=2593676 RepID=UPI003D90BDE0